MPTDKGPLPDDEADAVALARTPRLAPALSAAYWGVVAACAAVSIGRLVVGTLAVVASASAGFRHGLATLSTSPWVQGVVAAAGGAEPTGQTLVDFACSLLSLGLGVAMLASRRRDWSMRLLGLAMLAVAGTCNLSVQAAITSVPETLGMADLRTADVLLQTVAIAAFLLGLFAYPTTGRPQRRQGRREFLVAGVAAVVLGGLAATLVRPALSYVLLFGLALPLVGLLLLRRRRRDDFTADERIRFRLLFSVLIGGATMATTLVLVTALLWITHWDGLSIAEPTAPEPGPVLLGEPVLLFWFCRLLPVAIGISALTASRRKELYVMDRRFSLGLVVALVATMIGGLFIVVQTGMYQLTGAGRLPATAAAAVPAALLLYPAYVRVERWVDRLLYGRRPTPYSVLAGIVASSREGSADAPDLSRVAEALGRGLRARVCRLTVHRPSLGDRTYAWFDAGAKETDAVLTVPIVREDEQIGSLTVDRATVAGLHVHRQHLVEDVADSLGAVLEASRLGIELERQLRAVRAHAADIAASRRRLVAEMDAERRRIERDLHDGAQHHLVSLRLSLGLVEHQVATGQIDQAKASLDRITNGIDVIESTLSKTAAGVAHPPLTQLGLVGALESELAAGQPAVLITTSGMDSGRRFPADIESAVWFCCLEAVSNARKHAPGAEIRLDLRAGDRCLEFAIHDDGPGWEVSEIARSPGRGMRNVSARVAAVGGHLSVHSEPGAGTRIDGWVPLPMEPADAPPERSVNPDSGHSPDSGVSTGRPTSSAAGVDDTLPGKVRGALQDAVARYRDTPTEGRIRQVLEALDRPAAVEAAEAGSSPPARRTAILAAWSALQTLDTLLRGEPPEAGAAPLLHRLEIIRSGAHELAEIEAIDALRSGEFDLGSDDVETAARLMGEFGQDPFSRLGLDPGSDQSLVWAAAERALAVWRARASHPASNQRLRTLAATVVQSCEHLLQTR